VEVQVLSSALGLGGTVGSPVGPLLLVVAYPISVPRGSTRVPDELDKPDQLLAIALGKGRGGGVAERRRSSDRRRGADRRTRPAGLVTQERREGGDRRQGVRRLDDTRIGHAH
jgi:hypothetical protein